MNSILQQSIQWGIWTVLMSLVFYYIAKSRKKDITFNNGNELSQPLYVLIIGVLDCIFFIAIAIISNLFPNGTESIWTTTLFLLFSFLGMILIYSYFITKFSYDDDSIYYTKITGRKISIRWDTIESVKYNSVSQYIVIVYSNRKRLYFASMLKGIRPFVDKILSKVNISSINSNTLQILRKISNGEVV